MFKDSLIFFFFKQKTAYEMRISDWSSDVCSSDLKSCRFGPFPGREAFAIASGSLLGKSVSGEFRSQWSNAKLAGCGIRIVRIRSRDVQDACPGGYLGSLRTICRKRVERGHRRDTVAAPARTGRLRWKEDRDMTRSEEHTSELQSLMRISYAVFCLKKNTLILPFYPITAYPDLSRVIILTFTHSLHLLQHTHTHYYSSK